MTKALSHSYSAKGINRLPPVFCAEDRAPRDEIVRSRLAATLGSLCNDTPIHLDHECGKALPKLSHF